MKSIWLTALLALTTTFVFGCRQDLINNRSAPNIGRDLAQSTEDMASFYEMDGAEGTSVAPCLGGGEFTPDANNDPTDDDSDLIPVHMGTSYANCTFLGITFDGRQWREDTDPAVAGFAWQAAREDLTVSVATTSIRFNVGVTGSVNAGRYELDVAGDREANWQEGQTPHNATQTLDWTLGFTPDGTWDPTTEAFPAGTIDFVGAWNFTVDDASADSTLSTPVPVHVDPSCATSVDTGAVEISAKENGRNKTIRVDWSACGTSTVTFSL